MVLEILAPAAILLWLVSLLYSSIRLGRAQTPQEHEAAMRMLTGCIIGGVLIAIAPEIAKWITGLKTVTLDGERVYYIGDPITKTRRADLTADEASRVLPAGVSGVIDTVINLLRIVGGIVVIVGLIWGGISLQVKGASELRRFR